MLRCCPPELVSQSDIRVHVTETLRLQLHLELASRVEQTQVFSDPRMLQLDTSALGRVVNARPFISSSAELRR